MVRDEVKGFDSNVLDFCALYSGGLFLMSNCVATRIRIYILLHLINIITKYTYLIKVCHYFVFAIVSFIHIYLLSYREKEHGDLPQNTKGVKKLEEILLSS